ncbi:MULTISPECIES: GHMP kinase [Halorussus]|uniref:GHMP family kinase ATP-binding protein n=1 Tax=Halorussus TaxID=1070314 RepID=UPI00209C848E|nr:GHMP kinase [Halorussus vallis]USZ75246.1 GHMP kinase [Halorussus vallis]
MRAFAPGSVTAVFAPVEDADRSMGASFAVADGVVADVTPLEEPESESESVVAVDGSPTAFEPVELALDSLGSTARVDLTAEVPIGRGFGASGAATLATVLAADREFALGRSREELVDVAHRAEVEAGTGLGDVFVQDRGGLVVGDADGIRRFERETPVEYVSFGPISTEEALADDDLMARIAEVGTETIEGLPEEPSLAEVTEVAWAFAREVGLPTPEVEGAVADAEASGGTASMAMVGETVFAVGVEGVFEERTRVCSDGAHVLGDGEEP